MCGALLICLCDASLMRCVLLYGLCCSVVYVCVWGLMCLCDMFMISRVMLYAVFFVACVCLRVLVFCFMCMDVVFVGDFVMMQVGLCVCYCVYVFVHCVFVDGVCFIV